MMLGTINSPTALVLLVITDLYKCGLNRRSNCPPPTTTTLTLSSQKSEELNQQLSRCSPSSPPPSLPRCSLRPSSLVPRSGNPPSAQNGKLSSRSRLTPLNRLPPPTL